MTDGYLQVSVESTPLIDLRPCEDLFFSFDFNGLVEQASFSIDRGTEFGDAYAFRCFARLGVGQTLGFGANDYDLVELLRDYFSGCEQPVTTGGAAACRLFLKLVFGDLVKRIARARPGDKFCLQESDPLCGGAFAVLEGNFPKAERYFSVARIDRGSRAYAFAGLAFLRLFHSDLDGALEALACAGMEDDDIRTLSDRLQFPAD